MPAQHNEQHKAVQYMPYRYHETNPNKNASRPAYMKSDSNESLRRSASKREEKEHRR